MAEAEKLFEKLCLHEWFASGAGDASATDEALVLANLGKKLGRFELILWFAMRVPCVGVVAELAPHRTALEKGYEPYSRAIDCAKGFY